MEEQKFEPKEEHISTNGHHRSPSEVESHITEWAAPSSERAARAGEPAVASESGAPAESPTEHMPGISAMEPGPTEAPPEAADGPSIIREYFESIIITVIIALFITTFILQAYKIPTGSMESNLLIGDHLLVNKFAFSGRPGSGLRRLPYKDIKRGDIIVFKYPENPEQAFVKRVIGLPGDKVSVVEKQVFINDEPLDEEYTQFIGSDAAYRPTYMDWKVPPDHYFAMGDNRDNSRDSREWGFVPREYIIGRPLLVYWSFETEANEHQRTSLEDRRDQIKDVILNFFTKTRWDRTFKIVR